MDSWWELILLGSGVRVVALEARGRHCDGTKQGGGRLMVFGFVACVSEMVHGPVLSCVLLSFPFHYEPRFYFTLVAALFLVV